jgi:hypothetical protein
MGNRTVVVLYNDQAGEWSKDPLLGQKIDIGMNYVGRARTGEYDHPSNLRYGEVVELAHADTQTLAVLDGYRFNAIVHSSWYARDEESVEVKLLKAAAEKLGYKLIRQLKKESE